MKEYLESGSPVMVSTIQDHGWVGYSGSISVKFYWLFPEGVCMCVGFYYALRPDVCPSSCVRCRGWLVAFNSIHCYAHES